MVYTSAITERRAEDLRMNVPDARRRRLLGWAASGTAAFTGALLVGGRPAGAVRAERASSIVGAWSVVDESNQSLLLATFTTDGNLIFTRGPLAPAPPIPGFHGAYLAYSASQGVWATEADGTYAFTVLDFSYDDTGTTIGMLKLSGQISLDETRNAGAGPYRYSIATRKGDVVQTDTSSLTLSRIVLEPFSM